MPELADDDRGVLLGVTGGIAAFKAPLLVRRLRERGLPVWCVLTQSASRFVSRLTLEVLSGRQVLEEQYLETGNGEELHIRAANWARAFCVAPATANTLARLAYGIADDFLTTVALAQRGPLIVAPAMHEAMWAKDSVQQSVQRLRSAGAIVVGPEVGALASGEVGVGRMSDPETIVGAVLLALSPKTLAGRRVLVTAGPTREPLDPVRYLGNRSSGRMGFAIAAEAARRGASVVLVSGPVELATPFGVERRDVETTAEMAATVAAEAPRADVVVMAAAISDYRPRRVSIEKIKKPGGYARGMSLELDQNPDVLAGLAEIAPAAFRVGFAAETEALERHATTKLERKRVQMVVANDVSRSDIGFGASDNEVTVFFQDERRVQLERQPKPRLAARLLDLIEAELTRA